jgi:PAS domain S-box-containing protein
MKRVITHEQLFEVMSRIAYGESNVRVEVPPDVDPDHPNTAFALSFNALLDDLGRRQLNAETAVRDSEAKYRDLYWNAPDMYLTFNSVTGRIVECNRALSTNLGYSLQELDGKSIEDLYHPETLDQIRAEADRFRETGISRDVELGLRRKDGSRLDVSLNATAIRDQHGQVTQARAILRDITDRKRAERVREELANQQLLTEKLRERGRLFDVSLDMVCITSIEGVFLQLNPAFSRTMGYTFDDLLATPYVSFIHPDDMEETLREMEHIGSGIPVGVYTNRFRCKDGSYRWLQWHAVPESDGTIYAVARDVTHDRELLEQLRAKQTALGQSLKEREVLLQEVHHRVKNNLQVISSLINLQVRQLPEGPGRTALQECRNRVAAIALIHEKLYRSKNYADVPFSDYVRSLASDVFNVSGISRDRVKLQLDVHDIPLGLDRAIPCGLLINELVSNSLKHGFPDDRGGTVRVEMRLTNDRQVMLVVADDGVGLPPSLEEKKNKSLGLVLVTTLVQQLRGKLEIIRANGAVFQVTFPVEAVVRPTDAAVSSML